MFPLDESNIELINELENKEKSDIGRDLAFDFNRKAFRTVDGIVIGNENLIDKVQQWFTLMLNTIPIKFEVYKDISDYGVDTDQLIGFKMLPEGYIYSEAKREIEDAARLNPAVEYLSDFKFNREENRLQINFTVHLYNGKNMEVNTLV